MILDNEQQRTLILEMFAQVTFPGRHLDLAYAVKAAVVAASVLSPEKEDVQLQREGVTRDAPGT
jgi:hypothetical protein